MNDMFKLDLENGTMGGISFDLCIKYSEKYDEYKNRANSKKIEFNLSFPDFISKVTSECYICKIDGKQNELGLDRIDNKLGYTFKNTSGCCWKCNRMKSNMEYGDFITYLKLLNPNHKLVKIEKMRDFLEKNKYTKIRDIL